MTSLAPNTPPAPPRRVSVAELRALLTSGEEFALLDVRETGVYAGGHILWAVSVPLSHLELRIAALVPRRGTRIVVTDAAGDASGPAARAARRLGDLGYGDAAVLEGGNAAWEAEGHPLYSGINVVSKAFGEFVEHAYDTPRLTVAALRAKLAAGEDVVILDGRTPREFANFSLPGALSCPNAELPYRIHDLLRTPETQVVVNCAGRTRSIIGAQALINAGLPNPVLALENGTMAWLLDGHDLEHGRTGHAPAPSPAGLAKAQESVARLTGRFGVLSLALLLITHDLGVVAQWADRVVVLYAGRKVEEADAGPLFSAPLHPYTRGLLAASPRINAGRHHRDGPLDEIPGSIASAAGRAGCPFVPRCPVAAAACAEAMPPLLVPAARRAVACPVAAAPALPGSPLAAASPEFHP